MIHPVTPWASTVQSDIENSEPLLEIKLHDYTLKLHSTRDSIWIALGRLDVSELAFRAAFGMNTGFGSIAVNEMSDGVLITATSRLGSYRINITFLESKDAIFRYTTTFQADLPMIIPFWPRDIVPLTKNGRTQNTAGIIHTRQIGSRSGQLFFSMTRPASGSVFYFQNLTALSQYCEDTETSIDETVGGSWPEIGFRLPTNSERPMPDKKEYCLSDAFVLMDSRIPAGEFEIAEQFIDHLAAVYNFLPKPETSYRDWPEISKKSLDDLTINKGCWTYSDGHPYLNAYLCDYKTPPEIMVQMAVLYAISEYGEWTGRDLPVVNEIKAGLQAFYDPKIQTISRWLPSLRGNLDRSEEQKAPMTMDSWYLHHPLTNLAKLALDGHKEAEKLLMDSIGYAIKVAHNFDYEWPVFYRMDTLEVQKEETAPGMGGEKDVAGSYAYLMHTVYKLTGEKKYLREALRAAKKLEGLGLDIFYQANNTAFSALALLRLYKETEEELYLKLSYLCLAGILVNVQLSESDYGNSKNFPNFFGVFPLKDAPYKAAYEEMEVYAALNDYIKEAHAIDAPIPDSLKLLLPEFIRYSMHRLPFFYPPLLPQEILAAEIKTGELDPKLWIPIEDLYIGWKKNGQVGQEVYGAGVGFGVVPRQYIKLSDEEVMLFTDYPIVDFRKSKNSATFTALGNHQMTFRLLIIASTASLLSKYHVAGKEERGGYKKVKPSSNPEYKEFMLKGNTQVKITWQS